MSIQATLSGAIPMNAQPGLATDGRLAVFSESADEYLISRSGVCRMCAFFWRTRRKSLWLAKLSGLSHAATKDGSSAF